MCGWHNPMNLCSCSLKNLCQTRLRSEQMSDEGSRKSQPILLKHRSSEPVHHKTPNFRLLDATKVLCIRINIWNQNKFITSWKKLLSGYKLLNAILSVEGVTGSFRISLEAALKAVRTSYNEQTTQGSPTWWWSKVELRKNSARNTPRFHRDWDQNKTTLKL